LHRQCTFRPEANRGRKEAQARLHNFDRNSPAHVGRREHHYDKKTIDAANELESEQKAELEADHLVSQGVAWVNVKLVDGMTGKLIYEAQRP
jgi:hypothetical protein